MAAGSSTARPTTACWTSSSGSWPRPHRNAAAGGRQRRHGPSPRRPRVGGSTPGTASGDPWAGCPTARGSRPSARARRSRRICGCSRCPAPRPLTRGRAASPTRARPSWLPRWRPVASRPGSASPSRPATGSGSRARSGVRSRRPASAAAAACRRSSTRTAARPGRRGATFQPFKLLLADAGFAVLDVDFRGSTGYGRAFRQANHGEWGHADVHDLVDGARWATEQSWSDGRLAIYGGSYGGLPRPVRAGRGARDVAGRGRPLRRFGDRRELPPRRPPGPARPVPDDGLARRARRGPRSTGAGRPSTGRSASRPRSSSCTAARTSGSCR